MPTPDFADSRPVYVQIASDLRTRIGSGEYPTGGRLPSNKAMSENYGVAAETVRQALDVLRQEGLIGTQSTRGTFVIRQRSDAAERDAKAQVAGLRDEVHELAGRVDSLEPDSVKSALERIELNLMDLYAKLGFDYPRDGEAEEPDPRAAKHVSRA